MGRFTAVAAVGLAFFLMFATTASASGPTITYSITGIVGDNGWYRGSTNGDNIILHWSVSSDATSTNCLAAVSVPGDTQGTTQTCWATSGGGTTTAVTGQLKIDATPPTGVTASFSRGPDFNGWYNHPLTISWSGTDPTSGIAACSSATYQGPANGAATVAGGCTDKAGNSAASTAQLAYDATPPTGVTASFSRGPDFNGWYNHPLTISWSGTDPTSGIAACSSATYQGPANGAATVAGGCTDKAGNSAASTAQLAYDATPPTGVTASFSRGPDFNGWYNHPLTISWSGTDPTSGIAACSSATYQGPANGAATVAGGCTDKAGNSAASTAQLAYDATPPVLSQVRERSTPTADDLVWSSSSASDRVVVQRTVRGSNGSTTVFDGTAGKFSDSTIRDGAEYAYTVQSFDEAGNASNVVSIAGLPRVLTLQKTPFAPVAAPNPILRWRRVRRAAYYNVQLYRDSKRIYAAWPTLPQAGLPTTWKWSGHRFRLTPGRYHWYVWAGFGRRTLARYHAIGSARFVIPRT